jgi:uncharacterized protein YbjT (DUF2867 family)
MEHQSPAIAVLGATGKVGSQIVKELLKSGITPKALSRQPVNVETPASVHWVQGDIDKVPDMEMFLQGTQQLFLNSGVSSQMAEQQCRVIDIARQTGVRHIVKLSTPEAGIASPSRTGQWHWEIEEYLRNSGLTWNALRPQSFMHNWLLTLAPGIRAERRLYSAAADGKKAFIDTRDIARVVVRLFTHPGAWINTTIPLSGGALIGFADIAAAFSRALREPVTYISQSADEATERMRRQGMPEFLIHITLAGEAAQAQGAAEKFLNDNVEKITATRPVSVDQFALDYVEYFR